MAHTPQPSAPAARTNPQLVDAREASILERAVSALERNWLPALVLLFVADAALLLYMGRGLSFFYDDWDYVTHDYGGGLHSLLVAHNGHMSVFPVAVYKVLFHLVGLNHYAVFRIVLVVLHITCASLVFVLASKRTSRAAALLATALVLFLGAAWEDLLWAFQMDYMLSIAAGLTAWVLLERRDRLSDVGAALAVVVSVGSSGLGIPVLLGVAAELAWRRDWRRGFIIMIPAALYVLWYLQYGEDEVTKSGLINSPGFAEDIAAAAFGGLAGRTLDWGRPIAIVCLLVLLRQLARPSPVSARLVGLLVTGLSLWLVTAAARSTIASPETSRYVYFGAVVIVLVGVELLRETPISPRTVCLAAAILVVCVAAGFTTLHNGAVGLRGTSKTVTAELGALELAAARAPAGYQPDPQRAPQILAGPYLHTVRAIGSSPADSPAEVTAADPISRAAADTILITLNALAPTPLGHPAVPAGAQVGLNALSSGTQMRLGGCIGLTPPPGSTFTAALTLPVGGVAIGNHGTAPAVAALRRFGGSFIPLAAAVPPRSETALRIPTDAAPLVPWRLQLSSSAPLVVCGLGAP